MRIAISHQTFAAGDAIGNDIVGMCQTLSQCGHKPVIFCENNLHRMNSVEVSNDFSENNVRSCDLLIYHHSQDWRVGREMVRNTNSPVILRYHNITPGSFFRPYSAELEQRCDRGLILTREFLRLQKRHLWLCDSEFNKSDLVREGCSPDSCTVVAPFNNVDTLLGMPANKADPNAQTKRFLFVGRFAPNKGHLALLDFCAAYRSLFGTDFELTIVGAINPATGGYWRKFAARARTLNLASCIKVFGHLPDSTVHSLFQTSHAYLTFSEHEGFCVPLLEAQSVGLPIVGSGATAVKETAGNGQFLGAAPQTTCDFDFYATLAHLASSNLEVRRTLITNGQKNIHTRFIGDVIENGFLEATLPFLHHP